MISMISTASITVDPDCQPRFALNAHVVDEYADEMAGGAEFPPLTVYADGSDYWLADGFHRLSAALKLGLADISCDVRQGGKRDAILFAVGANASHGLRRSNADKRRAVETLLNDPEWSVTLSDREIARRCGVAHSFVASVKSSVSGLGIQMERSVRRGDSIYTMNTVGVAESNRSRTILDLVPAPMPTRHLSSEVAAYVFGDGEEDVESELPSAVEWTTEDAKAFTKFSALLRLTERDPKAVAYAAVASNQVAAKVFIDQLAELAIWQSRVIHELRELNKGDGR